MSNQPLVSVCVQTYQHASFIGECLEGILNQQTDFSFEVLVGEDNSTDGTREICREYAERDDRIDLKLHDRSNVIYIDGRPTGRYNLINNLERARGKYIALCEGDDTWTDTEKLQKQVTFLENNPDISLTCSNFRVVDGEGKLIRETGWDRDPDNRIITHEEVLELTTPKFFTVLFRRDALPDSFPDEFYRVYNGDNFLFALVTRMGPAAYLDFITGHYRQHSGGMWGDLQELEKQERQLATYLEMASFFTNPDERVAIGRRILRKRKIIVALSLQMNRYIKALRMIGAVMARNPGELPGTLKFAWLHHTSDR